MKIISDGKTVNIPIGGIRGPAGPDGNPIGTIINFMGKTAPRDYLICDGTVYNRSDFPDLASFFQVQFGASNYFGGDGENTIAVPDLRNLFLRGYHGEAEEQLSGDVGVKQEATQHISIVANSSDKDFGFTPGSSSILPIDVDSYKGNHENFSLMRFTGNATEGAPGSTYTSRPVNMAILYCIKAKESDLAENIYSLEEHIVGRWIDGKPVYERTIYTKTQSYPSIGSVMIYTLPDPIDVCIQYWANFVENGQIIMAPAILLNADSNITISEYLFIYVRNNYSQNEPNTIRAVVSTRYINTPIAITIRYTKTTDQATVVIPTISQSNTVQTTSYDFYQDYDKEVV